ncbi:MAG TPA: DUF2787 family protein [Methylobacter sp.]
MNIQHSGYPVAVSQQLTTIIDQELEAHDIDTSLGFIINFYNSEYSAENDGYHLVEISVDAQKRIKIITDYVYFPQGLYRALIKELEFDFFYEQFQQLGKKYPLQNGSSVFDVWQANFCACYGHQVYVTCIDSFA